jgi:hypothetical protein
MIRGNNKKGEHMNKLILVIVSCFSLVLAGCSSMSSQDATAQQSTAQGKAGSPQSTSVQTADVNVEANQKATALTNGWPESSVTAAKEMITKYGDPSEVTSDSLIWFNPAQFKKIIVHKEVFSSRFPLLHQTALEHVVDYHPVNNKVDDVWNYNGSVVLNRTKGEMSASGENEAMNILSLNLADDIMRGKLSADGARIRHGKETMNYLNGNRTAYTQVISFGSQINTTDTGESITNKIHWSGDTAKKPAAKPAPQAQEVKPKK